jgi:serine protease Do
VNAEPARLLATLILLGQASAQQSLESAFRMTGAAVTSAFEAQRAVLQTSSAVLLDGRREGGYGIVVSADGCVLAKASEFNGLAKPAITIDRKKYEVVQVKGMDTTWDVVLLKVEAEGLVPVTFAPTSDVPQGTWVVANGATTRTARRALCGIISAKPREIPLSGGAALGVVLKADTTRLEIDGVSDNSGAKEAGLQKGDVITAIDGKTVKNVKDIAEALKDRKAGTTAKVTYRRGKEVKTAEVRLAAKSEMFSEDMMNRNDAMSGDYSRRRSGFPRVIQHDILANSTFIGGPVLDLQGRCLGMNIARANRAETFAIPVEELREIVDRLIREAK